MDLKPRNKVKVEAGMSSMTDLVFLLLIFFIIMSTMAVPEYNVDLPSSGVSEPLQDGFIDVVVNKENEIRIEADEGPTLDMEQVKTKLEAMSTELKEVGGIEQPIMKIHADRESNFETFSDLMTTAKQIGLKIVVATK